MNSSSFAYKLKVFKIKLNSWEYWPMSVVYFPASLYFIYLSIRAKSFFFFSAANPSIQTGGMFFESKWDIFKLIPDKYYPTTFLISPSNTIEDINEKIEQHDIHYPFIAKPDRGERGWAVKIINNETELRNYHSNMGITYLIQKLVSFPLEYSVFYYRHPSAQKGRITSITRKEYLSVTGDGKSTIFQLIKENDRAFLQLEKLQKIGSINFNKILELKEKFVLSPFGNHVRGSMFLDETHIANAELTDTFDTISKQINGFYFGRFDLKCNSQQDLQKGENIMIVELNGAGAEAAHIYQPNYSFFKAQKVIMQHLKMMFKVGVENNRNGAAYMTYKEYKKTKKEEYQYKSKVSLLCL